MIPELENARVTELQVRMDCHGCVQRIKKAMHGIDGVYDFSVDFDQQKLTVIGRADIEKIIRAIRRTRRTATVCSSKEPSEAPNGSEPPPSTDQPAAEADTNQSPSEAPPPPSDPPKDEPPQESPSHEVQPSSEAKEVAPPKAKDAEEIHMIYLYPHGYAYKEHWNHHPEVPSFIAHGYKSYQLPYYGQEAYGRDYYHRRGGGDDANQITSMFNDENPNACTIV